MCSGRWVDIPNYKSQQLIGKNSTDVKLMSGKIVKVDSCIAPLVQMLNDYGIKTRYSCCGHGTLPNSGIFIDEENIKICEHPRTIELVFPYPESKHG